MYPGYRIFTSGLIAEIARVDSDVECPCQRGSADASQLGRVDLQGDL